MKVTEKIDILDSLLKQINADLCEAQERYKKSSDTDSLLWNSKGYNKGRIDAYNHVLSILHVEFAKAVKDVANTE